jgi:hypothetical protein
MAICGATAATSGVNVPPALAVRAQVAIKLDALNVSFESRSGLPTRRLFAWAATLGHLQQAFYFGGWPAQKGAPWQADWADWPRFFASPSPCGLRSDAHVKTELVG